MKHHYALMMLSPAPNPHRFAVLAAAVVALAAAFAGCGRAQQVADDETLRPPRARYGNLQPRAHAVETEDWNLDGAPDAFIYSTQGQRVWSERDLDFDGRIDFYEHYDRAGAVTEREFQLDFDDAIDSVHVFVDGVLARKELATGFDGTPSIYKFYDTRGNLLRVERDRDGDRIIDHVGYYEGGELVRVGIDLNGDGLPDEIEAYE